MGGDDAGVGFFGDGDEIAGVVFGEGGEADGGVDFVHGAEGAEIEGLQDDAALHFVFANFGEHHAHEGFGIGREFWFVGKAFGFDVEIEVTERGEIEQFIESGHAGAGDGLLGWKFGIADCATIPLFDLLECELVDDGAGDRAGADGWFENGVVRHDDDVVFGDGHVGFEGVHAGGDGIAEGGDGAFGAAGAGTAMAVDEDCRRGGGEQRECCQKGDGGGQK